MWQKAGASGCRAPGLGTALPPTLRQPRAPRSRVSTEEEEEAAHHHAGDGGKNVAENKGEREEWREAKAF